MPIEIRELVIRARVEDLPGTNAAQGGGQTGDRGSAGLSDRDLQAIVEMCTEAVMKIMDRQKQR